MMTDNNRKQDILYIQEWMQKEPQLPDPFEDAMILKFLHSCYYSLEKTKKCIDRFCTSRHDMPQVYTDRSPMSPGMMTEKWSKLFSNPVANYICGDSEMLILKLLDDANNFNFTDVVKGISIKFDLWTYHIQFLAKGHTIVYDMEKFTMKHLTRINPVLLKDFILYFLEGIPVRVKKILIINAPPGTELLYNIVKPVLSQEIREIVTISPDFKCLYKYVDKQYLPSDYEGGAQSIEEMSREADGTIVSQYSKMIADDNLWKGDGTKRPKRNDVDSMNGSFRTLDID